MSQILVRSLGKHALIHPPAIPAGRKCRNFSLMAPEDVPLLRTHGAVTTPTAFYGIGGGRPPRSTRAWHSAGLHCPSAGMAVRRTWSLPGRVACPGRAAGGTLPWNRVPETVALN